jgi:tRNA A-37 threonylcarbamoyl transferase component Bud32
MDKLVWSVSIMDSGNLDIISSLDFFNICNHQNNKIIKFGKVNQPKVYEKDDDTIIKLFYPKQRLLSSDRIKPRAIRFYKNVKSLHSHGYDVPKVNKIQFCPELKMYAIYYNKIQGNDVRTLVKHGNLNIINHVAELLADLHKNGIFFRSIHLENLLLKPDGKIALLDLTDVKFKPRALTLSFRYRNIKHLLQEPNDKDLWQAFGINNFLDAYFKFANLSKISRTLLNLLIKHSIKTS